MLFRSHHHVFEEVNIENDSTTYVLCFSLRKRPPCDQRRNSLRIMSIQFSIYLVQQQQAVFPLSLQSSWTTLRTLLYCAAPFRSIAYLSKLGDVDQRSLRCFALSGKASTAVDPCFPLTGDFGKHSSVVNGLRLEWLSFRLYRPFRRL